MRSAVRQSARVATRKRRTPCRFNIDVRRVCHRFTATYSVLTLQRVFNIFIIVVRLLRRLFRRRTPTSLYRFFFFLFVVTFVRAMQYTPYTQFRSNYIPLYNMTFRVHQAVGRIVP
jgi:hypothetical protein